MSRLNLQSVWGRGGVVQVHNTPPALNLFPQSCTAGKHNLLPLRDAQIIFHPNGIADGVLGTRCDREVSEWVALEIPAPEVIHAGFAAIVVAGTCEQYHGRRQAIRERSLIGAIEGGFTVEGLVMQFRHTLFGVPAFEGQVRRLIFKVNRGFQF